MPVLPRVPHLLPPLRRLKAFPRLRLPRPLAKAPQACAHLAALLVLTAIAALPVRALDPAKTLTQYAHRIWGQEEGLFQPTIYSILQTSDGFLWLGTQDSLIRFDGMRFREFDGPDAAAFHHSLIHALLEDRAGNLWVGSLGGGVAKIAPGGAITRYTTAQGLPGDSVFCLASDSRGAVWICTNQGLARFQNGRFRVFTTADGLPSNGIRATCEASDGTRWVAGLDFGLSRWNGSRFATYSDSRVSPRDNITALDCARDGSVWIGSASGLTQLRESGSRSFTAQDGLPDNAVSALAESPDGSIWIGANDGISRYRSGEFSTYRTRDGLSHSLVLSLFIDREGSLWAGTKDGLDQFTDGKVTPYTTEDGMPSNDAGPVLEDSANRLWIGTLASGLAFFDGRRFHRLTTRDGLASNTVLSLEVAPQGDLWVGTSKGLNRLRDAKVIGSYTQREGLSGPEVRAIFVDVQGTLWVGTNQGLNRFAGGHFVRADMDGVTRGKQVIALSGAHAARLFVSTDPPDLYYIAAGSSGHYPLDVIHSVDCYYLDHVRHAAWMGTLGSGLLRWENGKLTHVRVKDGLYDNRIYGILRDDQANFWMASSKGIFRVSQKELEQFADGKIRNITSIPFSTGQLRFECQSGVQPAACRTRDGRLWFSTTSGLVVVDPNHLVSDTVRPPVGVTAILVNGQRAAAAGKLELKPFENNVEIRYAGLSFVSPEKVTFRYLLEGYDKTWTDAGARREAFFTNLPPGTFRFEVIARNADGIWSSRPAVLPFTIEPRLYQRAWFFPLLALALALAGVAAYRVRIRQLNQRFNLVLAERTRIARELHDTLLQGLSGVTMQLQALWTRLPVSKEKQFLGEVIKDAGRCSTEARQSLWGLRRAGSTAIPFCGKLEALAREAVDRTPVALEFSGDPVSLDSMPETEYQLLRIAQEAISNSLTHSSAQTLQVSLRLQEGVLQLCVQDDGAGFATSSPGGFGHYGLVGMRERAAEIGARLSIVSSPSTGTCVLVEFPLSSRTSVSNADTPFEHQIS
ncbi:MAG TPA: two-component regulator propeller domain-containing protein [Bryobacteraceae bacterium]|jgi:ligand-binding sensor domain-containing protein/signal transduction histidine kinase|nr:two-component regulator propeller domain-containing protein [Bryobacteraceae bacterium]